MFNPTTAISNLAKASARRPWVTIGVWLGALAIAGVLIATLLSGVLVNEITITNNPESTQADNLIKERLSATAGQTKTLDETVIVSSSTLTVDDPQFKASVQKLFSDFLALGGGAVVSGVNYYQVGAPSMVSTDRHSTLISLTMPEGGEKKVDQLYIIGDSLASGGQFQVYYTGSASFYSDSLALADQTLAHGETVGILVALVVLAVVFGAIVAAVLPIALAAASIVLALGLTALVGQAIHLSFFVTNMVTMMGLAVGIDYSLFILSRYREERHKGLDKIAAIGVTSVTANRAIFFSGMTVVLALSGLLFFPLSIFKSMGLGSILVVLTAILASMTLLPAIASLLGDRVNSLKIPQIGRKTHGVSTESSGFWYRVVRIVTHRPLVSIVLTAFVLLLALTPYFSKNSGMSGISGFPDTLRSKIGFNKLQQDFHIGSSDPAKIVVDGNIGSSETQSAITKLQNEISADKAFASTRVESYPDKNLAIVYAEISGDSMTKNSLDAVTKLRNDYIPQAFSGVQDKVLVTGGTAQIIDFNQTTNQYTPFIFAYVLGLAFIILLVAFRSIVIPIMSILMNLLSVGAAYGLLVLVFQKGVGASLFGFIQVDVIETWLPLMLFSLLFGLSMDYQFFLLSRIRENYLETRDTSKAVAFGLISTGKLITGAALIMVAVFGGFALGKMTMFQQMGFGLGVAVLVDATLVRSILVPATMTMLGKRNWYLPRWLNWLPNISLGENIKH